MSYVKDEEFIIERVKRIDQGERLKKQKERVNNEKRKILNKE